MNTHLITAQSNLSTAIFLPKAIVSLGKESLGLSIDPFSIEQIAINMRSRISPSIRSTFGRVDIDLEQVLYAMKTY